MKSIIVLMILAIGFMVALPSTSSGSNAPPGQVSFLVDQSADLAVMVSNAGFNFEVEQSVSVVLNPLICKEGGGVEVQIFNLVTQPTYLIVVKKKDIDFKQYSNKVFRLCLDTMIDINNPANMKQKYNFAAYRFARDGLTQV